MTRPQWCCRVGALLAGLVACPLMAATPADSGAGSFWPLIVGLMLTIFGGMALCFGCVKLVEMVVLRCQARHAVPSPERQLPRAA